MTYFDWCCDGWCVAMYDDMGEMMCPCVPHDGRECIANCCYLLLTIGLILGVIVCIPLVLIRGLIIHDVSVNVEDTSLATFVITTPPANSSTRAPTTTLMYNLSMTVSVHNPNLFLGVDFTTPLEARYSYHGAPFGPRVWLAGDGDKLPAGKTWVYCPTMVAVNESLPDPGIDGVVNFDRQSTAGVFEVDMVVAGHYTVRGAKRSLAATCALKLPVGAPPAASSDKVQCV